MSGFGRALARGLAGGVQGFGVGLTAQAEAARKEALQERAEARADARVADDRAFRSDQAEIDREFRSGESAADREFRASEAAKTRAASAGSRPTKTDINGVERYVDTREPVFPGVEKTVEPPKPNSTIAKLRADYDNGLIGDEDFAAGRSALTKGQSFSVTTPDGTTIDYGSGDSGLGKAGQNKIDIEQIDTAKTQGRLDEIRDNLKNPEVLESLTAAGALKRAGLEWADYLSPDSLSEEQRSYLVKVTQARSDILTNVNFTIQQITGAAMGVDEAKRIIATLPNVNDSPTTFIAKLDAAEKRTRAALARYHVWRKDGMSGRPENFESLPTMERRIETRRNELMQLVQSGEMNADQASVKFSEEFGI